MRECRFSGLRAVFIRLALLCGMLAGATHLTAQDLIQPPFGLRWGDPPGKLISWAQKHSLDLNIFTPGDQPALRRLTITPKEGLLPDSPASSLEGNFLNGGLYELTLHYADGSASTEAMEKRFETLRKQIAAEHGALTVNEQQRSIVDQFVTRTRSFHREPVRGMFLLITWTEMEDLLRKTKEARFSLIYRNDNFKKELEERKGR